MSSLRSTTLRRAADDAVFRRLHVACTGDSRAVMGTWEPGANGEGKWRAEALSEDQTGKNPSEVKRCVRSFPLPGRGY